MIELAAPSTIPARVLARTLLIGLISLQGVSILSWESRVSAQEDSGIVGAPIGEEEDSPPIAPPPVLEPLSPPAPPGSEPLSERRRDTSPPPSVLRERVRSEPPPLSRPGPSADRSIRSSPSLDTITGRAVIAELQPVGGQYAAVAEPPSSLVRGERLRFRYPEDEEWRILEAYAPTEVRFFDRHYEIGGICFHSFRDGDKRIQVPTLADARTLSGREEGDYGPSDRFRSFVEVQEGAPKAPRPDGNCLVWQKGRLWLNDEVSGEIDTALNQKSADRLSVSGLAPGMIYVLDPPSKVVLYAVSVDFESLIFSDLGEKKGRSDSELARVNQLMAVADTQARRDWCEARAAYEQARGQFLEEERQYYDLFLRGELDSFNLIRSGHPRPHVQLAKMVYRHENLELTVDMFSDHQGQVLFPGKALLWINQAIPVEGTAFEFEISDKSDPAFVGFDTRFKSDGTTLLAEERTKGAGAWIPRSVMVETYTYATFRPPTPGGPSEYLLDVTTDITGSLKHLEKEMIVNSRLGTLRLTPDSLQIDLNPELLISPVPMEKIFRDIMVGPMDLRGWILGRRTSAHRLFDRVPMLPDPVVDAIESGVDELAMRMHEVEKERSARSLNWKLEPASLAVRLARTAIEGHLSLELEIKDVDGVSARVVRTLQPEVDLIDFAARSVAANRENVYFNQFQKLTAPQWRNLVGGVTP